MPEEVIGREMGVQQAWRATLCFGDCASLTIGGRARAIPAGFLVEYVCFGFAIATRVDEREPALSRVPSHSAGECTCSCSTADDACYDAT